MKQIKKLMVTVLAITLCITFAMPAEAQAAPKTPKATKITSVKASGKKIVVKYKKVKGASYQIQVATNRKMSQNRDSYKTRKTSKAVTRWAGSGRTYYVRVRTYIGKRYSKWSAVKSVKVPAACKHSWKNEYKTVTKPAWDEIVVDKPAKSEAKQIYKCYCGEIFTENEAAAGELKAHQELHMLKIACNVKEAGEEYAKMTIESLIDEFMPEKRGDEAFIQSILNDYSCENAKTLYRPHLINYLTDECHVNESNAKTIVEKIIDRPNGIDKGEHMGCMGHCVNWVWFDTPAVTHTVHHKATTTKKLVRTVCKKCGKKK